MGQFFVMHDDKAVAIVRKARPVPRVIQILKHFNRVGEGVVQLEFAVKLGFVERSIG